jgi:hypothetical protein
MNKQDFNFKSRNLKMKNLISIFKEAQQTHMPKEATTLTLGEPLKVNPQSRKRGFKWRNLKLLKPPKNLGFPEKGYIN